VLGHVRLRAAGLMLIEQRARLPAHQVRRLGFDVGFGDRKLHALVLADRPVEHHPFLGVRAGPGDEPVGIAYALRGDQDALGVQSVQNIFETLPSSPMRFSAGISRLSKNNSQVS